MKGIPLMSQNQHNGPSEVDQRHYSSEIHSKCIQILAKKAIKHMGLRVVEGSFRGAMKFCGVL